MFGFVEALFVLGGGGFWISSLCMFILILALSENDHEISAGVSLAIFAFGINYYNELNLGLWQLLGYGIGYFMCGSGWSVVKWFSYLHKSADRFTYATLTWIAIYNEKAARYNNQHRNNDQLPAMIIIEKDNPTVAEIKAIVSDSAFQEYFDHLQRHSVINGYDSAIPNWRNEKGRFTTWILWWPTSMFWTFLNDPIVRLAQWIHQYFGTVYQRMAEKIFGKAGVTSKDFTGMR